ncbi:Polyribonucleotide nucleotidyltransferase [Alkaliphilus metalliredigens QYMF]|uniref:Polyribonucleotide nucleotidyltransferase 1 n=1 Tax=Alkaliphilus metalliredigens (strain QYMF) TaxID=293826 RepID=PNP1_ALKMQ|nr:polyribonucleotide nucleotidyltransferase [Alkaliphilus metalliredigens]A6TM00.1 RecName: Full=Polyribonucleotide nucleotidyltransferase 1; AltName: Full=Polynucleotide phosphorylase 1; Short=PNPase 1 [Alkaliphilus metalliredigens QYMF]ABR47218.1 Polyribonucleotide nucleotidyltransferase [Alkaliphilus metalliredigens QYMF]
MIRTFEMELGGRPFVVELGKVAELAQGSCMIKYGDTFVLVTACASKEPKEGLDFFPLSCDYEEKLYAVGKIPGGFIKRESRPSEKATLTARLIDRPIRPLFPKGYHNDVQVIATVLSVDQDCPPDISAMIGSSIALSVSNIPFMGPTASVSVGMIDGEYIVNPTSEQKELSELELIVSGTKDAVMMIEAGANELTEAQILDAIMFAHEEIKKIVTFIEHIVSEVGKPKSEVIVKETDSELLAEVVSFLDTKLANAIKTVDKTERNENIKAISAEALDYFEEKYEGRSKEVNTILSKQIKVETRKMITSEGIRPDNRKLDEIRPISSEVGILPRTHGTGLFTRGETQVLTVTTLGDLRDAQRIDGLGEEDEKRYMHHYNFPPYSVGETRFMRGPSRREIGHGALVERALKPMIPCKEDFPYAIRLVSEVLACNGSSSQASVCGSTLSLMDAGVPIKGMVAGIAMGLIKEEGQIAILSDIQGMEDALGDMDLKVAGTENGITALQMDIKIAGIDRNIMETALAQAKIGRTHILNKMKEAITSPRTELSAYAPQVTKLKVHPDKVREVIGAGGKVINKIIDETGVKINIENDGTIYIAAPDQESARVALEMIELIVKDPVVGEVYTGKVIKIMDFGAFVEILPGKEGLVHISNLAHERVAKVADVLAEGDLIEVKLMEINPQGKIGLSRKALLPKPEKEAPNKVE